MPQADLDLLERRAAEVGELGDGSPEIMGVILPSPALRAYLTTASKTACAVIGPAPTRPAFDTRRSTAPESIPAAAAQPSSAVLAQDGIGTVRTRPCLPRRSTIAQRPSRCATSLNSSSASSPLRSPPATRARPDPAALLAFPGRAQPADAGPAARSASYRSGHRERRGSLRRPEGRARRSRRLRRRACAARPARG